MKTHKTPLILAGALVVSVLGIFFTQAAQQQRTSTTHKTSHTRQDPPQWEYEVVKVVPQPDAFEESLNKLGKDGFELVSVVQINQAGPRIAILKRPIVEAHTKSSSSSRSSSSSSKDNK